MTNNRERREGADGKLYFTFNQGAEYKFAPPFCSSFTHKIIACEFDDKSESEYFRIESAGKELPRRFSVAEIKLMQAQFPHELTDEGEPVELPLLLEEVREYFAAKAKLLAKANVAENAKLKGTKWNANNQAIAAATESLRFERANGNAAKADELQATLEKLETEQKKILTDKHVDVLILHKVPACKICNDTGIIEGKICECARKSTAAIKSYCAAKRLAKHD